ncbi:Ras subfamily of RAS small GTPases [Balamuthia mandrillaris]
MKAAKAEVESGNSAILPTELQLLILSFLSTPDLIRCSMVCREWHALSRDPSLSNLFLTPSAALMVDAPRRRRDRLSTHPTKTERPIKVVLLGHRGTGRTSFVQRFFSDAKVEENVTRSAENSYMKTVEVDGCATTLECAILYEDSKWPATEGPNTTKAPSRLDVIKRYKCQGFLLFYSITSRQSFDAIPSFVATIQESTCCNMSTCPPIILVGNRTDEERREVTFAEGKRLADSLLAYKWYKADQADDAKRRKKKKDKKKEKKEKEGFVFRKNFFEISMKDDTVMFYGVDQPIAGNNGAVVVDELVRQVDEWRYRMRAMKEKELSYEMQKEKCAAM